MLWAGDSSVGAQGCYQAPCNFAFDLYTRGAEGLGGQFRPTIIYKTCEA